MIDTNNTLAVIGLGYVGLPLAVEFGKTRFVIGFDVDLSRIVELQSGHDRTLEISAEELKSSPQLTFTADAKSLVNAQVYIIAVPTPVDSAKKPDLSALQSATIMVANSMKKGAVVIYESTVYPGCSEDFCVPILEEISGLTLNEDFFLGYSPERANPGDKLHRVTTITKVTSGSTPEAANAIDALYASIVVAGTHKATSIKVAEAAKVIENTQRDLNIALMNELAIIFEKLDIDTLDVLEAAATKWNFLPFKPGLVGGHCIGVDPYYLTYCSEKLNYHAEVILAGRRINDKMGSYVADRTMKLMMQKSIPVVNSRILVMGLTFKENCPDLRNSKVIDVIRSFTECNVNVDVFDPWVKPEDSRSIFDIDMVEAPQSNTYDAVVLAVGHKEFLELGESKIKKFGKEDAVFFDLKGVFDKSCSDGRL